MKQKQYSGTTPARSTVAEDITPHSHPETFALPSHVHAELETQMFAFYQAQSILKFAASSVNDQSLVEDHQTHPGQDDLSNLLDTVVDKLAPAIKLIESIYSDSDAAQGAGGKS